MSSNDAPILLARLAPGVEVRADSDGVHVCGAHTTDAAKLSETRLGRLLPTVRSQLLEGGLARDLGDDLIIPHENFINLLTHEIDAFDGIAQPSPFTLALESTGWLGSPKFKYFYSFCAGTRPVYPRRVGCFLEHSGIAYQLDGSTFALLEAIDNFNAESAEAKSGRPAFITFAKVKGLAEGLGTRLDRFISRERILVAGRVGLDLIEEPDGRISFAPKIDGAPDEAFRRVFFASDDAEEMYSLDDGGNGRIRVILDDDQREVLRRMQQVRHLGGAERVKILRDPHAVFDGIANNVDLDLGQFGPRVKGIGDFPFVVQPYVRMTREDLFDSPPPSDKPSPIRQPVEAGLECRYADGSTATVVFAGPGDVADFRSKARDAWLQGQGIVEHDGKSIALDETLIKALDEQSETINSPASESAQRPRRYLLIHTNEEALDFAEKQPDGGDAAIPCELPSALRQDRLLKEHQKEGVAWLQECFRRRRRGCLLADDMGLGKTLQVLTFLAWLIERGDLSGDKSNPEGPPWDAILVIAPLVLLENEVWQKDMREFFTNEGNIFQPWLSLRGPELNRLRRPGYSTNDVAAGEPVLDVQALRNYRVVFTNYETVVNYQFSLARRELNWSVVVTDEAQEYKTPNTKISHALKALMPRFRIACTGTPVETRLRDVWNIFDFLQPGHPLKSVTEFTREFEEPYQSAPEPSKAQAALNRLRERFEIGGPNPWILRRDKQHKLPGLPEKREHQIKAPLSDEQRSRHLDVMKAAHAKDADPFKLLHELMDLYQHPALRPRYEGISPAEAVARCPKVQVVLDCLSEIQRRGEKALIFARRVPMQQLLKTVIDQRFGLSTDIINGDRAGLTEGGGRKTRQQMLDRFRSYPGFNVLILSPVVAGLGLTIVEANHVIHYGRWWNPALEAQATDRVYRIGQLRRVHVYYPIAIDPATEFVTFDEKLARIIDRRRQMAQDFLMPLPGESDVQKELLDEVLPD